MAFDFPSTPTVGQIYNPPSGPSYVWDGIAWTCDDDFPLGYVGSPFKRTVIGTIGVTTSFQFDDKTNFADIEVCGGGGGGGGATGSSAAGQGAAGSGGGGGGYCKKLIQVTPAVRAATKSTTVGVGGTAGGSVGGGGGNSGYSDGTNSVTANGGQGGVGGVFSANGIIRVGGQGGVASGGDFTAYGGIGGNALQLGSTNCGAGISLAAGGPGGSSHLGGGGQPLSWGATSAAQGSGSAGGNGYGYGGGGAGGAAINAVGGVPTGGVGYQGIIIITEYR